MPDLPTPPPAADPGEELTIALSDALHGRVRTEADDRLVRAVSRVLGDRACCRRARGALAAEAR